MTALTADRNTPETLGRLREGNVGAGALIYAGSIVMRNATGFLVRGATALNLIAVGRAEQQVDNSLGADGALTLRYLPGVFRFANSAGADQITDVDIGTKCFVVDDQTVAKTDGTATRSKAGIVEMVDAQGVWVRLDEALTKLA